MQSAYQIDIIAQDDTAARIKIKGEAGLLSFRDVFELWQTPSFSQFFTTTLINIGFEEVFWEHPAVNQTTWHNPYEFMLLRSGRFGRRKPDLNAFADYIDRPENVVAFHNLRKDAKLIVPTKKADPKTYKQLGSFIKQAPQEQVTNLFDTVGKNMIMEVEEGKTVWLNTAGLGVIWLHVRLDSRPKYYKIQTYKKVDFLPSSAS
ncbi:MAG: hypothetical protein AAFX87_22820 [Bacteroidota bacterium]